MTTLAVARSPRVVLDQAETKSVRCGACSAQFSYAVWRKLTLVERVSAGEVRRAIVPWPDGMCIEIRRCARCNKELARTGRVERTRPP